MPAATLVEEFCVAAARGTATTWVQSVATPAEELVAVATKVAAGENRAATRTAVREVAVPEAASVRTLASKAQVADDATSTVLQLSSTSLLPPQVATASAVSGRDTAPLSTPVIRIGARVRTVYGDMGVVRYCGNTHFKDGEWVGVELEGAKGKNDGEVRGVRYFR